MKRYVDDKRSLQIYGYRIEKIFKEKGMDLEKMIKEIKRKTDEKSLKKKLYDKYYEEDKEDMDKMMEYAERYIYFQYRMKELDIMKAEEKIKKLKNEI